MDLALRLASTAVLARLLAPDDFGMVMMVMAVTGIADQFRDLGLSTATVQKANITHPEVSNLFWINASAGAFVTVILCALSPLVAIYYRDQRLTLITCVLASNFVLNGLAVQHQALLARTLRLGASASVRLTSSLVSTALAIALAWWGVSYWALIWREVVRAVVLTAGMWICLPWVPSLPTRSVNISDSLRFGANLSAANVVVSLCGGFDRFLLGRFWGAGAVGIYRQAYQLLIVPIDQLLSPAYQVTQPGLSVLQSESGRFARFYLTLLLFVSLVTMPLSVFVAVHARDLVLLLLGPGWLDAVNIVVLLSAAGFVRQTVGSTAFVLIARGQSALYLRLTVLQSATLVVLMLATIKWGAVGVAAAEVAATYLLIAPRVYYTFKNSPISITAFFVTLARPALASVVMGVLLVAVARFLPAQPAESLVVSAPIGAVFFFGAWALLPGGGTEIRRTLKEVLSAVRSRRKHGAAKATALVAEPVVE